MPLKAEDFPDPYDLNATPTVPGPKDGPSGPGPADPPAATADTGIPWWSPANALPTGLGQYVNEKAPTWGELGQGIEDRIGYIAGRGERGLAEAGNWSHQRTDPTTGQTYWIDMDGNRISHPPFSAPTMVRPDLPTGMVGSIAEDLNRNPLTYVVPAAGAVGSITNELMQGFPSWERNLVGGAAGMLTGGGWRDLMRGSGPLAHVAGHLLGGHLGIPGRLATALIDIPATALKSAGSLSNWGRAIIAGHVAGVDRPNSEPTVNQLQSKD